MNGGEVRVLHIVNGDSIVDKLRSSGIEGEILAWRELYTKGPLFLQPELPEHRVIRAAYMERELGIPQALWIETIETQEKRLAKLGEHDEVVLWFEHDLFDQTMLCYLLHWFARNPLNRIKLSLLCIGEFPGIAQFRGLGQLSAEQLSTLIGKWHEVAQSELTLGSRAWEAYVSSDPKQLLALIQDDTSALPFLHDAFQAHLNRYPSDRNGLGLVEQKTLELLSEGCDTPFQSLSDKLHILGMGDLQYWLYLRRMSQGSYPLITIDEAAPIPIFGQDPVVFLNLTLQLTHLGKQMLIHSSNDWVSLNGIDTWLGGVHLLGNQDIWRWNPEDHSLVQG